MSNNLEFDRAGFPMVWLDSINAHMHLLPVTKIQFEYFLWDAPASNLDQGWLDRMYKLNERVTPKKIGKSNYWRAFMSGLAPMEAERFASWAGGSGEDAQYSLPTDEEWRSAYKEVQLRACIDQATLNTSKRLSARAQELFRKVADATAPHLSLADQMLFDGGVLEWLQSSDNNPSPSGYTAHGQSNRAWDRGFSGNWTIRPFPVKSVPKGPDDNESRWPFCGFRLLRRA